jgi:membrane fusion protein (multidrug efflux system)
VSGPVATTGNAGPGGTPGGFLSRWRWSFIIGGPLLIVAALLVVITSGRSEATDNAYVQIAKAPVASSINGRVIEVYVHENQLVRKGDPLFRLDARDYQVGAQAAAAQVARAELQVRALRATYAHEQSNVRAARAALSHARVEAARERRLSAAGVASRQQADEAADVYEQARERLAGAEQQAAEALANLGGSSTAPVAANPSVMQAQAQLAQARLNVSYTTVNAPAAGIVTRVDQMPIGTYLSAAQTAFWLLSGQPWIEANFKEDQLAHMRIGQPVKIKVDAYPNAHLKGRVVSFSPGTGSAFSALPTQNATGNWVKVVQRLPVRIEFDRPPPGMATRAGLSAAVKVVVRARGRAG